MGIFPLCHKNNLIMPLKTPTKVKYSVFQNEFSENCDKIWNVLSKNKQLPEGAKPQTRQMKRVFTKIKHINIKSVGKAMSSFNKNNDTKNMSMSVSDVDHIKIIDGFFGWKINKSDIHA